MKNVRQEKKKYEKGTKNLRHKTMWDKIRDYKNEHERC